MMASETVVKRLSYVPSPATMKPCAVDGELCQPFPERESPTCSWHWFLAQMAVHDTAVRDAG